LLLIGLLSLVLHLIDKRGLDESQFGDTGDWGTDDGRLYLTIGDKDYVTDDIIDTFLIAGTDAGGQDMGEGFNGDLADFIMLLIIDRTTEKYAFYQIDRNTMTDVPVLNDDGEFDDFITQQITTAHWYGFTPEERNENLANAVVSLMGGMPFDTYYVMNLKDIGTFNDAIDGVTVTIPTDMTAVDPAFKEGATVHLEGDQAEKFVRARMSLKDDTNSARMSRQEQYIKNAYNMVLDRLRQNPEYISDIYDSVKGIFETNGTGRDISRVTNEIVQYENQGFLRFDGETRLGDTMDDGEEHEEFYPDPESIVSNLRKVINLSEYESSEDDEDDEDDEKFIDPDDLNQNGIDDSEE
jgi:anionic cell wall polymer biosynthesis LytR-Cps2A-Psr (LCP) family protein